MGNHLHSTVLLSGHVWDRSTRRCACLSRNDGLRIRDAAVRTMAVIDRSILESRVWNAVQYKVGSRPCLQICG